MIWAALFPVMRGVVFVAVVMLHVWAVLVFLSRDRAVYRFDGDGSETEEIEQDTAGAE